MGGKAGGRPWITLNEDTRAKQGKQGPQTVKEHSVVCCACLIDQSSFASNAADRKKTKDPQCECWMVLWHFIMAISYTSLPVGYV